MSFFRVYKVHSIRSPSTEKTSPHTAGTGTPSAWTNSMHAASPAGPQIELKLHEMEGKCWAKIVKRTHIMQVSISSPRCCSRKMPAAPRRRRLTEICGAVSLCITLPVGGLFSVDTAAAVTYLYPIYFLHLSACWFIYFFFQCQDVRVGIYRSGLYLASNPPVVCLAESIGRCGNQRQLRRSSYAPGGFFFFWFCFCRSASVFVPQSKHCYSEGSDVCTQLLWSVARHLMSKFFKLSHSPECFLTCSAVGESLLETVDTRYDAIFQELRGDSLRCVLWRV